MSRQCPESPLAVPRNNDGTTTSAPKGESFDFSSPQRRRRPERTPRLVVHTEDATCSSGRGYDRHWPGRDQVLVKCAQFVALCCHWIYKQLCKFCFCCTSPPLMVYHPRLAGPRVLDGGLVGSSARARLLHRYLPPHPLLHLTLPVDVHHFVCL